VLDAVRQFSNLPFEPVRSIPTAGLHADLRYVCRRAAKTMNRYPVKDPLAFVADDSEDEDAVELNSNQDELKRDDEELLEVVE
jgi:hypothetical protein